MSRGITTALSAIGIAQLIKLPLRKIKTGKWEFSILKDTGGMPSSHSAGVSALTTYVGLKKGFHSVEFAVSTLFGLIVMYDAAGIRRHAGEIAIEVNELDKEVEKISGKEPGVYHERRRQELKERLGHQPSEVLAGSLLGVTVGVLSYWSCKSKHL